MAISKEYQILQETIETEIANETQEKENKKIQKESDGKRALAWIMTALAVAYGLLPIDMVPDVPIVGWMDDFMINVETLINLIQRQFFQTNIALNKLFNIIKLIFVCLVMVMLLLTILLLSLTAKR